MLATSPMSMTKSSPAFRSSRRGSNQTIDQLTDFYTAAYNRDLATLGCLPPTMQPRARESMPAIIALISTAAGSRPCLCR
jgi:cysteinyl-tRNA synthetase